MNCKKCGKKIDDLEIYCNECKEIIRKEKELDKLINENKELNKLEITKEVETLQNFKDEKKANPSTLKEELKDIVNIGEMEKILDEKDSKKNIFVIISIIIVFTVIGAVAIILTLTSERGNKKLEVEEKIDYEKIINDYGKSISLFVIEYLENNEDIPSWSTISDSVDYEEYRVVCDIHNIYSDGNIYLNHCKVDGKLVEHSYGVEKQEIKEGKKLEIYKSSNEIYSFQKENDSQLVGFITCKTDSCEYIVAYNKYALIKEEEKYYIYNYENNSMEFGPFNVNSNYPEDNLLMYNNELYGVIYEEDNKKNIYNINTQKILKNLDGELVLSNIYFNSSIMYKYGYAIFKKDNRNNFVNLKTGNVSYFINGNLYTFMEDTTKNLVYITTLNSENSKITIYNSNGKKLFNGKEYDNINLNKGELILSNDDVFYIYDSSLKLKITSKKYNAVLGLYNDFIVVVDNEYLAIVDLNDNLLATFDLKWDSEKYNFHSMLSGWYTENGKHGIYLVVENKELEQGIKGSGLEYYYIPDTKEIGVIETTGIGGYAKPVLYLYPKEKTNVTVTFSNTSLLTTTYPKFINEWNVTAYPNGDLYDRNNKYYYGLYWEEDLNHFVDFNEGFYVDKEGAIEFLEEKLDIIGLNDRERNEFIMYWLPILEKNEKSLVYFELTKERDSYNKLLINPKPDSLLRIAIHIKKVNKKTAIKEQQLNEFKRNGFVAVEWGGVIYR